MKCDKCDHAEGRIELISIARPDELNVCVDCYHKIIHDPDLEGMWILKP